jgi:biopolymer transport protein ExbD
VGFKTLSSDEDSHSDSPIVAEINITPLTDIFLVLLIIFMVTSSVLSQSGVDVQLPQSKTAASQTDSQGVVVSLLPGGAMKVNGEHLEAGQYEKMEILLKQRFAQSSSRLVILEGDRQSFLGSAIEVMDHARQAGAEKFAIATVPTKEGGS